jgi:hypothetical protein
MKRLFLFSKGQTTIELLLVLGISLVILASIYALYAGQLESNRISSDYFVANSSIQKIVNAANTAYFSGVGSRIKVDVEFPRSVEFTDVKINSNVIELELSGSSNIVGIADINIVGILRPWQGRQIFYLVFDGNVVNIDYDDFELNKQVITIFSEVDNLVQESFAIRNNYSDQIKFFIQKNFSHDNVLLDMNVDSFFLSSGEIKIIDLNFTLLSNAQGNYSGNIIMLGQVNDTNFFRTLNISVEAFQEFKELTISPNEIIFDSSPPEIIEKGFSVCNKSAQKFDLTWTGTKASDQNIISWIVNWDELELISEINSGSCTNFLLKFDIPNEMGEHEGFFTAHYIYGGEDANYSSTIIINVE